MIFWGGGGARWVLHMVSLLSLTFCLVFLSRPCILHATLGEDGDCDSSDTTLLDLQHGPASLPLGHTVCEGQGNVARGRCEARRYPRAQAGEARGSRAVLPLRAGAVTLFDCGSDAGSLSGS